MGEARERARGLCGAGLFVAIAGSRKEMLVKLVGRMLCVISRS